MEKIGDNKKKIILSLRWTVIIVTSYLILFGKGKVANLDLGHILILAYILSNFCLVLVPKGWFSNTKFFCSLVIIDSCVVSFAMYISERVTTDFYLVFFLIIIFASISRNYKLLMTISGITALVYGALLYSWGLLNSEYALSYILRIPFILIMAGFYGYIVQTFTKERQKQLTISEDKYRGLFENANDGIIILSDPELLIADANKEVEALTGYKRMDLLQRKMLEMFPPIEKELASRYFEKVIEHGEGRTESLSVMGVNGTLFEVDLSTKRIEFGEGAFYQMIFRDLSEQRRLEKKIRESKRNLEAIFDGITDQLSIRAPDYRILRVNRAVIEKYHTTFQELIGKKCYEVYYDRNVPCEKCPVTITFNTKQPASAIQKNAAIDSTLHIFSYPILDEKGNISSVIEYSRDITEEQRLQEQLIQSEKLAGIGILASGVAHEINNPLSGILGMAEIALEEEDYSKTRGYLTDILNCAQRIADIVNGLRLYSRASRDEKQTLVDLNEVLKESLRMVRLATKTKPAEIIKKFQPLDKIEANLGEIQQVFTNLITNAFQAMDSKSGKLVLATRSLGDAVEVKVSDDGMGIPPEHLKKIFDPFFTTKNPGDGTGLGLNIVYRIVTKYEGRIDVESKKDMGTTFTIRFPVRRKGYEQESVGR